MTDTVSVPVDLLKRVRETYPTLTSQPGVLADLLALIPAPPIQVGDKILAARVKELPARAVIVDIDDDSWVLNEDGTVFLSRDGRAYDDRAASSIYEPFTVVFLPEP